MIIQKKTLKNVLFIDIETVSQTQNFLELSESLQQLWIRKSKQFLRDRYEEVTEDEAAIFYKEKAGIFAEFGKIVCISVGYMSYEKSRQPTFRIKSLYGDEIEILKSFNKIMNEHYDDPDRHYVCGHNIRQFDVPYLCRRNIINGQHLPRLLNVAGKKSWQLTHLLDIMDMWKFGDYKNYTGLDLLAGAFGIPSPKKEMDGSKVGPTFWEDNDIERIVSYCQKDVTTVAQIALRFAGQPLLKAEQIEIIKEKPKLQNA